MAPSRGKGKTRASSGVPGPSRRTPRTTRPPMEHVPAVYRDLLAEAEGTESSDHSTDRPLKKRRLAPSVSVSRQRESGVNDGGESNNGQATIAPTANGQQTVEDSSESAREIDDDDDDESDLAFEDVDLDQTAEEPTDGKEDHGIEDLSISVDASTTPKRNFQVKRTKPVSATERAFRVLVHKAHILCLLGHCMYVNGRCNNEAVHRHLRSKLSKRTISYLNPNSNDSQFQRDRSFIDGLQQASEVFRGMFKITESGMRRPRWPVDGEEGIGDAADIEPIDRAEFIRAAKAMEGSQDTANQLFCAMLRAVGVEARLVCSLQVLPFANVPAKSSTPQKFAKHTIYATPPEADPVASDSNTEDTAVQTSSSIGKVPSARRRLGQPTFPSEPTSASTPRKRKPIRKLTYPIFWTEAFNAAQQKWISVDPIVTQTIAKPSKFEPPSSYDLNQLCYAIAIEPDGAARDVTRRYARAYNAKTRRLRVENTEAGAAWWKKTLRFLRRRGTPLDREQVEDAELARREAREGLPGNVQDFKEHPYYALERHLKRHEVFHPKREVGKVNAGTAAKPRMEAVFRREDVCVCRSAEKWFRLGRVVQRSEQAIKRVPGRRARREREGSGDDQEENVMELYALFQTELYVPPPVVKGKVPRNAYGNLDVYVPSMVPAGGAHIRHPLAQQAARILRVDFADAVTGFQFKGRHGTAVVEGVIVAELYADAVRAVVEGLEDEKVEEESKARSAMALRVWRRLLTGLRIQERVSGYGDVRSEGDIREEMDALEDEQNAVAEAGGFFPNEGADDVAMPTAGRFSLDELSAPVKKVTERARKKRIEDHTEEEAEFSTEDEEERLEPAKKFTRGKRRIVDDESEDEYMPDAISPLRNDEEYGAGGFLPDDAERDVGDAVGLLLHEDNEEDEIVGGFLPDDDADVVNVFDQAGGGFLVENDAMDDHQLDSTNGPSEGHAGEVIAPSSQLEANVASQSPSLTHDISSYDRNASIYHEPIVNTADLATEGTADVGKEAAAETDLGQQTFVTNETLVEVRAEFPTDPHDENDGNDDESDRGSMISHDPEDEDAEPDWLEMND